MSVKNINTTELQEMIAGEEIELIDVREEGEFSGDHIKNASNIPMSLVPLKLEEIDFSKKVVLYCRSGARSFMVANSIDQDDRDMYNLDGGMMAVENNAKELIA